jgi:type III pantothenate kinase
MIVLMDIGNSRIKLGWLHPSLGREPSVHAIALRPLEAMPALLRKWLSRLPMQPIAARGVNVAGTVVAQRLEEILNAAGCPVTWLASSAQAQGVRNAYDNPEQLGADRWAALLGLAGTSAGAATTSRPLVLATFGTATTIDTLGPDRVFEGGLILPGPALMRQSLAQGTANLPLASGASNDFPKHTLQAISTGVVAAQAGAVWRQCAIVEKHYACAPMLFVSGGGWPEVEAEVRKMLGHLEIQFLANPVLDGLARMA